MKTEIEMSFRALSCIFAFKVMSYSARDLGFRGGIWQRMCGRQRISFEMATMYHINKFFVMSLTSGCQCSYVEMVASAPQPPRWFVSHAWR